MRAFDPEIFNNNGPYRLVSRIRQLCEEKHIKSYLQNHWIMIPSEEDATELAEAVMADIEKELGTNTTVRLTGNILWDMCKLEL